ncbi:MAG: peptidase M50, partial [Planctomycetes bacterium]|nr:peptidase M50 [Planctomycetota bacterium]
MAVDRPTFSESWYRVATLKPRLRSTVQVYRQQFRGQTWHVLQDPASNQFSRLSEPAYRFVGLLDGRRTVSQAWEACNDQLGDAAPTQGEAIQLLGQLYVANLLQSELPR